MPLDGVTPLRDRLVPPQVPTAPFCGLALVGEAPGEREAELLRPFCGPSGGILDSLLRAADIDRASCWVGNVFLMKLEDNSVKEEKKLQGSLWNAFQQANLDRLAAELSAIKPTLTIALGATALQALAGTSAISTFRGQPRMGIGAFSSFKILPTWHPAAIMRSWGLYPIAIGDMLRAKAELAKGPSLQWPKRTLNISPSIEEVEDAARSYLHGEGPLSCDIETGWGMVRGISFAPSQWEAIYVPFISLNNISRSHWPDLQTEARAWKACKALLESDVPKLGQNFANYDMVWLLTKMGIRPRNVCHDLRLLHKTLYPELPASLAFMGSAHSDQGAWKAWAKHGGSKQERGEKRDE